MEVICRPVEVIENLRSETKTLSPFTKVPLPEQRYIPNSGYSQPPRLRVPSRGVHPTEPEVLLSKVSTLVTPLSISRWRVWVHLRGFGK